jgi:hypothetical protein
MICSGVPLLDDVMFNAYLAGGTRRYCVSTKYACECSSTLSWSWSTMPVLVMYVKYARDVLPRFDGVELVRVVVVQLHEIHIYDELQ